VHAGRAPGQQASDRAGHRVLLLQDERHTLEGRHDARRRARVSAGHHDRLRTPLVEEASDSHERRDETRGRPPALERMRAVDALHGEQEVVLAAVREDARLESPPSADEDRVHVRPSLAERIRDGEGRVEVATRAAAREHDHRPLMHGPPFRPAQRGPPR
jgi:hypothetical protein